MSNTQGYLNSARLVLANIGLAGNRLEELIALGNPDAARKVGRDERTRLLRVAAEKLAEQRQKQGGLEGTLATTMADLATQKKVAARVVEVSKDTTKPQPSEQSKKQLAAKITQLKQLIERTEAELAGVKTAVEFLDNMVEMRAEALQSFDAEASTAQHRIDMANLRKDQANLEGELSGMAQNGGSTAGLSALNRAADRAEQGADAAEIVNRATGSNPSADSVMADIMNDVKNGPKVGIDDELAALSK